MRSNTQVNPQAHYEFLGLPVDASLDQITIALNGLSEQKKLDQRAKEVHEWLLAVKKKKLDDEILENERKSQSSPVENINANDPAEVNKGKNKFWQWMVNGFNYCAEAANIGIVLEIVGKLIPAFMALAGNVLPAIVFFSTPTIYLFRSLIALTLIVGEHFFDIKFQEVKHGRHPYQTAAHIARVVLFSLAIPFFLGVITVVSPPIGLTIGWVLALSGLGVVGHFDYAYQAKMATKAYERVAMEHAAAWRELNNLKVDNQRAGVENQNDPRIIAAEEKLQKISSKKQEVFKAKKDAVNSHRLFVALLIGLTFLLLASSIAVFAPPVLVPVLLIVTKIASGYLTGIALGRFWNWLKSGKADSDSPESEDIYEAPAPVPPVEEPGYFSHLKTRFTNWVYQKDDPKLWLKKYDEEALMQKQAALSSSSTAAVQSSLALVPSSPSPSLSSSSSSAHLVSSRSLFSSSHDLLYLRSSNSSSAQSVSSQSLFSNSAASVPSNAKADRKKHSDATMAAGQSCATALNT